MLQGRLNAAFKRFNEWKRENHIPTTQARFTCARLNRKGRGDYPALQSKAVAGKRLSFWLAEEALAHSLKPSATELDKLVSLCASSYVDLLRMLSEFPFLLSEDQAGRLFTAGHRHLLCYTSLRNKSAMTRSNCNRSMWPLLPKHHYMLHMILVTRSSRVNPRNYTLLCAEGFVGHIGRMARLTHRSSVSRRVIQKYKFKFQVELKKELLKRSRQ